MNGGTKDYKVGWMEVQRIIRWDEWRYKGV